MKKILALLLALICIFAMFGCAPKDNKTEDESKKQTEKQEPSTEAPTEEPTEAPTKEDENTDNADSKVFTFDKLSITLPEGFQAEKMEGLAMAVSDKYPTVADNINFMQLPADKIEDFDPKLFAETYEENFENVKNFTASDIEIDGVPTYKFSFDSSSAGVNMKITQLLIFTEDSTYTLTFTNISEDYAKAFEDCIKSIKISK